MPDPLRSPEGRGYPGAPGPSPDALERPPGPSPAKDSAISPLTPLSDRQVAHALREALSRCACRMGCSHRRAMMDLALEAARRLDMRAGASAAAEATPTPR